MSKLTRRSFVKSSLAVAAAASTLSAPAILRAQGSNDKMSIAVIGCRSRGKSHIGGYLGDDRVDIKYIVDANEKYGNAVLDGIESKQGFRPQFVRDMRDVFADKELDAISTATPNHWHALTGIWAMQAGKHAYIEKPVCHNIAEGSALIAAARKYNRMCQVGTQCRSNPSNIEAVKFINEGGIGDVNFARGLCYKRRKSIGPLGNYEANIPKEVDFNLWSGPATYTDPKVTRQQFDYDWHWQRHYGNGDLGNQGPHQTDIARWGLGVDTHPNSVLTYGGRLGYQAERNAPNYVDAGDTGNTEVSIYDYGDKCMVFETRGLDCGNKADQLIAKMFGYLQPDGSVKGGNRIGVIFYGTDGYLAQTSYSSSTAYDKDLNVIKKFSGGADHFSNFIDACISGDYEDLNADVREGHLSAAISHLGNISYYLGEDNKVSVAEAKSILEKVKSLDDNLETLDRTVKHWEDNGVDLDKYPMSMGPLLKFDPEKEVFPESPEATAMITREYREEFTCPTADKV